MDTKLRIAIVGIGDVFTRFYFNDDVLLKIFRDRGCVIFCADKTEGWDPNDKKYRVRDRLRNAGFAFVDVSDLDPFRINTGERFELWVRQSRFDLIVIATPDFAHIGAAIDWIKSDFDLMIIEKPFSDSAEKVNELLENYRYRDENGKPKVLAFSHFRAKIHQEFKSERFRESLLKDLGGGLTKFRFFCLEDYSATDESFIDEFVVKEAELGNDVDKDQNGPIEIPKRETALDKGMIFDLGSHMLSVLGYFGTPGTVELERIWAAQYVGVGFDHSVRTKISGETFAALDFTFIDFYGDEVEGQAFIGKGIRGIDVPQRFGLGLEQPELGEVKLLEVEGISGKKIQVFFKRRRASDKSRLYRIIDTDGSIIKEEYFPISKSPYFDVFEEALRLPKVPDPTEFSLFFDASTAQSFLRKIEEINKKIQTGVEARPEGYPTYRLGIVKNGETIAFCESLDEIMSRIGPIWEKA